MSSVREAQVEYALGTRERQAQRAERMLNLLEDQPNHHGYAVVVKDHAPGCECDSEGFWEGAQCDCGYDAARDMFWRDAKEIARAHGFEGVYQEGRSGGYCVVRPQPRTDDMYPEEVAEWERERFGPFAVAILELFDAAKSNWRDWVADE